MSNNLAILDDVVLKGDLSKLSDAQRIDYYRRVCESVGVNPYTKPFDYITLNNKLTLYATKTATDQLRKLHGVSIDKLDERLIDDAYYVVTAYAHDNTGRIDSDVGAVYLGKNLQGEARANAIMKAATKAKRRVTLSICGLGWLDESEIDSIPDAQPVTVDHNTGEVLGAAALVEPVAMVTEPSDRIWQRWLELVRIATDLKVQVEDVQLPIARPELVKIGGQLAQDVELARAHNRAKDTRIGKGDLLEVRYHELLDDVRAADIEYPTDADIAFPANRETVIRAIERLEDVLAEASFKLGKDADDAA